MVEMFAGDGDLYILSIFRDYWGQFDTLTSS